MADLLIKRKWQILLSLPFALYLFYSIVFLCPDSLWRTRLTSSVNLFWNYWRLDQNWALFSPIIRDINYHATAIVTFEDGTQTAWDLPRMNKLCMETAYRDEKWRKWAGDSVPWPNYKQFWPDLARYIGRKFYNRDNRPTEMALSLYWTNIPPPAENRPQSQLPYHSAYSHVYSYRYTPEDFQ